MTSQRVERTQIRTGGYRRFRGEWVKLELILKVQLNKHIALYLSYLTLAKRQELSAGTTLCMKQKKNN